MTTTQHGDERCPHCAPAAPDPAGRTRISAAPVPAPATGSAAPTIELVDLPGGTFRMGNHAGDGYPGDGETPVHTVTLAPFAIAPHAVTNAEFAAFVAATDYRTESEVFGWSFVFEGLLPARFPATRSVAASPWWRQVHGAAWNHPEGPDSGIEGREHHPVIHVSWNDAAAYCAWSGTRLPTEAEWEYAARGGSGASHFWWGHELNPGGKHRMNVWQGKFPARNTRADGYVATAPVDAYEPNGFGLYNVTGNVWEWCADWFGVDYYATSPEDNPAGPDTGTQRVMRGGSYLCHKSYCNRYRVDSRSSNTPDSATGNLGFRVARSR